MSAALCSETILLVEDNDLVRNTVRNILESRGYLVLVARDGSEGLSSCQTYSSPIDLLLTDVIMPKLDGRELADAALKLRPGLKVMFMSGHFQDVVLQGRLDSGASFLAKPFTAVRLTEKVRETLNFLPANA